MFGKTLKVDMPYLREHGVARLLIGCLDYTRIPDKWNIFVVDGFYELSFEVETPEDDPEMEESQTEKGANNDDDDPNAKKYEGPKDAPKDQDEVDQATPMEATYDVPNNQSVGQSVPSQQADRSVQAKGVIFSPSLKRDIEESKRLLRDMFISDQGVHDISKIESDAGSVGAVEAVPSSVAVVPTEKCEVAKTEFLTQRTTCPSVLSKKTTFEIICQKGPPLDGGKSCQATRGTCRHSRWRQAHAAWANGP
jgi:hypothetical protein